MAALHASRLAVGADAGEWGPGAALPVRAIEVSVTFDEQPHLEGRGGSVSAGTLGSIVEISTTPTLASSATRPESCVSPEDTSPTGSGRSACSEFDPHLVTADCPDCYYPLPFSTREHFIAPLR